MYHPRNLRLVCFVCPSRYVQHIFQRRANNGVDVCTFTGQSNQNCVGIFKTAARCLLPGYTRARVQHHPTTCIECIRGNRAQQQRTAVTVIDNKVVTPDNPTSSQTGGVPPRLAHTIEGPVTAHYGYQRVFAVTLPALGSKQTSIPS